ncbi:hypothetical protein VL73_52 [Erwinia phage VL73]
MIVVNKPNGLTLKLEYTSRNTRKCMVHKFINGKFVGTRSFNFEHNAVEYLKHTH